MLTATATTTTTTTTTASSTDNDNSRRSTCHHSQHQHLRPHRHHHHHHHHRHHHHSQHHQTVPRLHHHHQEEEEKSTHHPPHQPHHHHHHDHDHGEQQVQQLLQQQRQQHSSVDSHPQHRKAKLHTCPEGTATQIRPSEEANSGNQAQVGKAETLEKWDTKLLSGTAHGQHAAAGGHHLAAGIGVAGGAIGIGGGGVGGDKQHQQLQQQQLAAQQQQQQLLLAAGGQMQDKFRYKGLSLFVILLMCLLLALNVILLLKLWKLEEHIDVDLSRRARMPSLAALKELPNTNQDWLELLRQQELSHESELRKWHQVLQTAIELLKKTEKTLAEVMIP